MSEQRVLSDDWRDAVDGICDAYLGELPRSFTFGNKRYTPESFRDLLGIDANNVSITSFSTPFGASFALEVPDFRGEYLNVALDELRRMVRGALEWATPWRGTPM